MAVFTDLYEIIARVELDGAKGRLEKYRVKRTAMNFLPQRLTPELEGQGYSHRLCERIPVDSIMKVQRISKGPDHVHLSIYCLESQKEAALAALRLKTSDIITKMRDDAVKLYEVWNNRPMAIKERQAQEAIK